MVGVALPDTGTGVQRAPTGRPAPLREIIIGLVVFAGYSAVASADWPGRRTAAAEHARDVFALERWLHIDVERSLNRGLAPHDVLRVLANYEYAITYVASAFGLLLYLWLRRPDVYVSARRSFVLLNVLGITGFVLYPLTPPRLLPGAGFVDTVRLGHTWGSWGSPLVGHANQLAAMPSLHFAWALWVSAVLARVSGGRRTQVVSAVHVLLTLWVILATANHFLLDAVVAGVLVAVSATLAGRGSDRVPGADAFFLHVESAAAPQHVGGVVLLDTSTRPGGAPTRLEIEDVVRRQLGTVPRFRQLLVPGSRWRRTRWRDERDIDWAWHVPLVDLTRPDGRPGGLSAFHELVARLQETRLPRDRPLWRLVVVHGIDAGRDGFVLIVHHVVADGIGTVAQALRILEPFEEPGPAPARSGPRPLQRALATALGLVQLAGDGRPSASLASGGDGQRRFGTAVLSLSSVRQVARQQGARVSDVVLSVVAGGLRAALRDAGHEPPAQLRVSVPLMVRDPRDASVGNVTGAVLVDLPLGDVSEAERLAGLAARTARLRRPSRALAARFVMQVAGEALPPVLHAAFARAFYGPRTFAAIVSNMPGPEVQLSMAGAPLEAAFPLLPLAPGAPLAVGVLGWNGDLCIGISADPALLPDAGALGAAIERAFVALRDGGPAAGDGSVGGRPRRVALAGRRRHR